MANGSFLVSVAGQDIGSGDLPERRVAVESWLHGLSLANATKAKVRNVIHGMFAHACRMAAHESHQPRPAEREAGENA